MIIDVGIIEEPEIGLDLSKLLVHLNHLCDGFRFSRTEPQEYLREDSVTHPESFRNVHNLLGTKYKFDWIIYFTEKPFDNNFFYDEFRKVIIVSFYGWELLTKLSKNNGFIYFICGLMADAIDENEEERHYINTGCIFDFLLDKAGIHDGMKKASICPDCFNRIASYNKTPEDLLLLHNLDLLMKELSSASIWDQDILVFWGAKFNQKKDTIILKSQPSEKTEYLSVDFDEIVESIKSLELKKVFSVLENATNQNLFLNSSIVLLSANWNELKNKEGLGVIDLETSLRLRNRIILSVLDIVNEIKTKGLKSPPTQG